MKNENNVSQGFLESPPLGVVFDHSRQVKAESLVAIAMGNAHRNRNEKQFKPCKGVSKDVAL